MYVCMYDGLMDGFGSCLPGEYKCHDDTAKLHLAYNRSIQRRALKSLTCLWTYLIMAQPWKKIYVHICVCMNVCGVVYTCVCGYACLRIWMQRPGVKIVIHCSPLFKFLKISDMVCACSMHMGECCIAVSMHAETRGGCFVFLFSLPHSFKTWPMSQKLAISTRLDEQRIPVMHLPLLPKHYSHRHMNPYVLFTWMWRTWMQHPRLHSTAGSLTPCTITPTALPYFLRQDLSLSVGLFSQALADKQPLGFSCICTISPMIHPGVTEAAPCFCVIRI